MATTRLSGRLDSCAISRRLCSAQRERERTNENEREKDREREWVDLANLLCFLLPVHYCYKKSQSIMQCEKKKTQGWERVRMKDRKVRKRERGKEKWKPCYLHEPYLAFSPQNNGRKQVHGNVSPHCGCVCARYPGSCWSPRSVLTSPSDRDNRVRAVTITLCLNAH